MPIHHVTYEMQMEECIKGKLNICYKGASPPTQETNHTQKANKRPAPRGGGKKGSTPPAKEQKSTKTTSSP
jgi:hypothetical protein